MTPAEKEQIDNMDYETMLRLNRFGQHDNEMFRGESGVYFIKTMYRKKDLLSYGEAVSISKKLGWEQ